MSVGKKKYRNHSRFSRKSDVCAMHPGSVRTGGFENARLVSSGMGRASPGFYSAPQAPARAWARRVHMLLKMMPVGSCSRLCNSRTVIMLRALASLYALAP